MDKTRQPEGGRVFYFPSDTAAFSKKKVKQASCFFVYVLEQRQRLVENIRPKNKGTML